jgi:hypothetical protein
MAKQSTIILNWDNAGRINISLAGEKLPTQTENMHRLLAPGVLLLTAHQFGVFKPSRGLIICDKIIDILFKNKYTFFPINSALKSVTIDSIYMDTTVKFLVHPKHGLFADSDSLEEGMQQVINNYILYIYNQPDEILQLVIKRYLSVAIELYFRHIEQEMINGHAGKVLDKWTPSFSSFSAKLVNTIISNWVYPKFNSTSEFEGWKKQVMEFLVEQETLLAEKRNSIFEAMRLI